MKRVDGYEVHLGVDNDRPLRRCVDCGCRTTNYRCKSCWANLRDEEQRYDPGEFVGLSLDMAEVESCFA